MGHVYGWWEPGIMPFIMWIFPVFGIIIMLVFLYILISFLRGRGSYVTHFKEGFTNHKRCPSCKSLVEDDFLVCPRCGTELSSTCPHCKRRIEPSWIVCPYCKYPLKKGE